MSATATPSIKQRILDIVDRHAGVTYDELRHQLVRRGGEVGAGSFALAIGDLIEGGRIVVRGGVITRRKTS